MALVWSDPRPPIKGECHLNHVVTTTPVGPIRIEWEGTIDGPSFPPYYQATMPWNCDYVTADSLDECKEAVQAAWDAMVPRLLALCSIDQSKV